MTTVSLKSNLNIYWGLNVQTFTMLFNEVAIQVRHWLVWWIKVNLEHCSELKDDRTTLNVFEFYFFDMHLHAYNKASYQTCTNSSCHSAQIIPGTSVQIRIEKVEFCWRMKEEKGRPCFNEEDCSMMPHLLNQTTNRPGSNYYSRCFNYLLERLTWADSEAPEEVSTE